MTHTHTQGTEPAVLYGVFGADGWMPRLFLADELSPHDGELCNNCAVTVIENGTQGQVRRVIASSEWRAMNYYSQKGWQIPFDVVTPAPDERMGRFNACDEAVDRFITAWLSAARAALEIERDRLWEVAGFPSNRAYWVAKGEAMAAAGHKAVTYERVLQLIGAAKAVEGLESEGIDPTPFQSEKSLRALAAAPKDIRSQVAQALTVEHQVTGRPITEVLTKKASADHEAGLTLELLQERFAPYGVFRHFTPTGRKNQRFRFAFEGGTGASLFASLTEANDWLNAQPRSPRAGLGCPTCANCISLAGGTAVCGKSGESVLHTRIWNAPGWCGGYTIKPSHTAKVDDTRIDSEAASSPVEASPRPAPPTPQENIHERLTEASGRRNEPNPHDENMTPPELWEPALLAWGVQAFDLDPMSSACATVPAVVQWTATDDCFAQSTWAVADRVMMWANPAFSLNEEFSVRFVAEFGAGHITEAFILDKADSRTQWSQRLLSRCSATCRIFGYTKFDHADRENGSATFPLEILYFGPNVERFASAYKHLGLITIPF